MDSVGKPLALALHALPAGNLTCAGGIERSVADLDLTSSVVMGDFVVSSNVRAIALWQSLGFEIVGRLPLAFRHPSLGFVDALVMLCPL